MRILLLEHEDFDLCGGVGRWAAERSHPAVSLAVHRGAPWPDMADFDFLIALGGTMSTYDEEHYPWLRGEKAFLRQSLEAGKAVFGICFGAQLLAEALGGRVFRNEWPEIGWQPARLTAEGRESFLFQGLPDGFEPFNWHNDHYQPGPATVTLSRSAASPHQSFVSLQYPAAGIQFHPEFGPQQVRLLVESFGRDLKPGPYALDGEAILNGLEKRPDAYPMLRTLLDNMERHYRES